MENEVKIEASNVRDHIDEIVQGDIRVLSQFADGIELPGLKKKSFSMYFGGGEIWFEHLDGMYGFTDLVIQKLAMDYIQFKKPSMPSLIAVNLDETHVNEELCNEIVRVFTVKGKRYTKIVFVGVKRQQKKLLNKLLAHNGFALAFINDFEKAKEWLISENNYH